MTHFRDDPFKHLLMQSVSRPAPIASTAQAGFFLRNADLSDDPVEGFHDLCYFLGEAKERLDCNEFDKLTFFRTLFEKWGLYD